MQRGQFPRPSSETAFSTQSSAAGTEVQRTKSLPEFLKKKKLWESSVEAGVWIRDLFKEDDQDEAGEHNNQDEPTESPTKKRKRQAKYDQGSPRKMRKDVRRSSAKAFLSVIVNKESGEPRWQWRDVCGQAAPIDLVKFRDGLTLEQWQMRCIRNHDYHEERLASY